MADDDWDPDLDFPGLDSSAVITDVGVDQFVLCQQVRVGYCRLSSRVVAFRSAPAITTDILNRHWPELPMFLTAAFCQCVI